MDLETFRRSAPVSGVPLHISQAGTGRSSVPDLCGCMFVCVCCVCLSVFVCVCVVSVSVSVSMSLSVTVGNLHVYLSIFAGINL